jgi:oligopeptide/dipeptide ABC transporter ATP-binding protein
MDCAMPSTPATAEANAPARDPPAGDAPLLALRGLTLDYPGQGEWLPVLRGVDLELRAGECLGVVGESGSGKSQLLLALLGLSGPGARLAGSARYRGTELLGAAPATLAGVRGRRIALVFQDALSALNPYLTIGSQLREVLALHLGLGSAAARARAIELLGCVRLDEPELCLGQFPHELSGGMRQRVLLALALAGEPDVLLLDEPTTALDVTVQAQLLALLRELRARTGIAMVFVTHDLGVLAGLADRVAVMYAGRVVEEAPAAQLYAQPLHPYTGGLLRSLPRLDQPLPHSLPCIAGQPPEPGAHPDGCAFAPRCPLVQQRCLQQPPERIVLGARVSCHREDAPTLMHEAWR